VVIVVENQLLSALRRLSLAVSLLLGLSLSILAQDSSKQDKGIAEKSALADELPADKKAGSEERKPNEKKSQRPNSNQDSEPIPSEKVKSDNPAIRSESDSSASEFDDDATFFSGNSPTSIEDLRELERKFAEVSEIVKPATVNIQMGGSQGSGVVVTADGYILTAAHVIGPPGGKAKVTFPDKKQYNATTLGVANRLDSGILKIDEGQADEFPHVEMGLSSSLKPGQWIIAIGHPGGIDEKRGLVVRAGRILKAADTVIQTDCTLVGGDSGGPLVDLRGEVVGIHSRIGMNLWDNMHVPVDAYSDKWDLMVEGLVLDGRPRLGFRTEKNSLKVEHVTKNEAADKAGIKVGDVIKKISDRNIEKSAELKSVVAELLPNQKIKVIVARNEEELTLDLVVGPTR
jgi:serine protease Do